MMRSLRLCPVSSSECGFAVRWQHIFRTANGVRKPNILAVKGGRGHVLDIQIILGARALSEGHTTKRDYYASNLDLLARVGDLLQVEQSGCVHHGRS